MTDNEKRQKKENAEKERLIFVIEMKVNQLGDDLYSGDPGRNLRMFEMSISELQQLLQNLTVAISGKAAITMIVSAIVDSEDARRTADDNKYEAHAPATMETAA